MFYHVVGGYGTMVLFVHHENSMSTSMSILMLMLLCLFFLSIYLFIQNSRPTIWKPLPRLASNTARRN
jgi:hypothetical protein